MHHHKVESKSLSAIFLTPLLQMSISFNPSLTEVYEYPASEPSSSGSVTNGDQARPTASGLKSNSAVGSNLG